MIFLSPHAGYNFEVRPPIVHIDPNTGFREDVRPQIYVDFLDTSVVATGVDGEGNAWSHVRGGCFDTDEAAARLGWLPEEKLLAEQTLLARAKNPSQAVTLWEPAKVEPPMRLTAEQYAELHPNRVVALASELKQVAETLAYERESLQREDVLRSLERKLAEQEDAQRADEALTAA